MISPRRSLSLAALAFVVGLSAPAQAEFLGLCPANSLMAGPTSGPPAAPSCRPLASADVSAIPYLPTGINLNQTLNLSGTAPGPIFQNNLLIQSDTIAVPGLAFMTGWSFSDYFGGSTATGGRQALQAFINQTAPTSTLNANPNYVAGTFLAQTATGDGGTNLTTSPKGSYFGINPYYNLQPGAVNVGLATGAEFNSIVQTGASVKSKGLANLVGGGALDQVQGGTWDYMLALSNQAGGVTHRAGILFGDIHGAWPIDPAGSLISTTGASATAAEGVDLSNSSFSDCSFKSKNFSSCLTFLNASLNSAGVFPTSAPTSWSMSDNFSNSNREINLFNDDTSATVTLVIYQKTSAAAATPVLSANTTNIAVPGIVVTAMPTEAHAGSNACVGYDAVTKTLYISSTVTTC